jgi:hypothetical protein
MNKRSFNLAYVKAELRSKITIQRFEKEFEQNGNQNQSGNASPVRQNNDAQGNVPQQPQYGG